MEDQANITNTKETLREARRMLRSDPVMRLASLRDSLGAFFGGDLDGGKLHLRDVVKYGIGYEALAFEMGTTIQSINRMLSRRGNPTSKHLFTIMQAVRKYEGFVLHLQVEMLGTNNARQSDSQ